MKIKVKTLDSITPTFDGRGSMVLQLDVFMREHQAMAFIYDVWELYGDNFMQEIFHREGYSLTKQPPQKGGTDE